MKKLIGLMLGIALLSQSMAFGFGFKLFPSLGRFMTQNRVYTGKIPKLNTLPTRAYNTKLVDIFSYRKAQTKGFFQGIVASFLGYWGYQAFTNPNYVKTVANKQWDNIVKLHESHKRK